MTESERILARWRYWEPLEVIASLQRSVPRLQYMVEARRRHEVAATDCRSAGLSWEVIERHALDDPREDAESRRQAIRAALERQRTRTQQTKQKVFERYKRRANAR